MPLSQSDLQHDNLISTLETALECIHANRGKVTSLIIFISQDSHIESWSSGTPLSTIQTILTGPANLLSQILEEKS